MATHDFEQRLPRQGALALKQRMIVIHVERDDGAVFACLWADARRSMPVFFPEVLLSENSYAYPQAYQKEQRPFNPSRAPGAPWVGSHYSSTLNLRYATRSRYDPFPWFRVSEPPKDIFQAFFSSLKPS